VKSGKIDPRKLTAETRRALSKKILDEETLRTRELYGEIRWGPMKRNNYQYFLSLTTLLAGLLCTVLSEQVLAQEGKTKIRISYPSTSIANLALFAAQQWGIFERKRP
jgi:hypothetical protein